MFRIYVCIDWDRCQSTGICMIIVEQFSIVSTSNCIMHIGKFDKQIRNFEPIVNNNQPLSHFIIWIWHLYFLSLFPFSFYLTFCSFTHVVLEGFSNFREPASLNLILSDIKMEYQAIQFSQSVRARKRHTNSIHLSTQQYIYMLEYMTR